MSEPQVVVVPDGQGRSPVGPVYVRVRIDEPRRHEHAGGIQLEISGGRPQIRVDATEVVANHPDVGDPVPFDDDIDRKCGRRTGAVDHSGAAYHHPLEGSPGQLLGPGRERVDGQRDSQDEQRPDWGSLHREPRLVEGCRIGNSPHIASGPARPGLWAGARISHEGCNTMGQPVTWIGPNT